uniref:Erythromycin esterase n=1 Tax=Globisporangium ultimum (strain ATCC 200006 / CBS 805.95 / DAOM BR144) TaxID=431595 RepID=K3X4X3_GLOUD
MWRNEVVRDFVQWLQAENLRHEVLKTPNRSSIPVALFGLDIYSMFSSTDQVISYLEAVDPPMAERARQRYGGLRKFRPHEEAYCRALLRGEMQPQNNKIKAMLEELDVKRPELKNVFGDGDEYFSAHENARIVLAAEEYYRESYFGSPLTWNIRDHAMVDMIMNALAFHDEKLKAQFDDDHTRKLEPEKGASKQQRAEPPKSRAIVWAHNSHIGDAAATEQYERWGQVNIGHLVRQVLGKDNCFLIGLSTNTGTVRAAKRWNGRDFVMDLNPALPGSTGNVLHQASKMQPELKEFGLFFRKNKGSEDVVETGGSSPRLRPEEDHVRKEMEQKRLERFIGVQYVKPTERQSHYSMCSLSNQFDLMIHLDETSALRPLPELTEPKASPSNLRPGTVDRSKRGEFAADEDDDEERA